MTHPNRQERLILRGTALVLRRLSEVRILDYDGFPHDADTGERTIGDNERPGHWMDELPAINLTGLVLITSPNDMIMTPAGRWVRRNEWENQ